MTPDSYIEHTLLVADDRERRDYRILFDAGRICGTQSGEDALRQAIRLRLLTEKGLYPVFSAYYGLPFGSLTRAEGDVYFIQLKNSITETLLRDRRICAVDSFEFSRADGGAVHVRFRVVTAQDETLTEEADFEYAY